MEGLRGDLNERFAAAIAGMEAGLQGNTAGIGRLINQQRLTGTASAKTAAAFADLEMTMGLSREATNKLASDMVEMGAEYGTSTDVLVNALNNMAKSFPAQKLAGMGAELNGAVAALQTELGPAMSGPLNSVMNMIMDTSMEGYENLTKLGIGSVREQLAAAKSQEEAQSILKDAIGTASMNFKSVVGDASKMYASVGVATDTFGKSAIDLVTIQDAFGQRVKVERTQTEEFGNQLGVLKSEILVPLQAAFLEFFPIIKEVSMILMEFAKGVVTDLVEAGKKFFETLEPVGGSMEGFKAALEEFRPKVVEFFTSIGEKLATFKVVLGVLAVAVLAPLVTVFMALKAAVVGIATFFGITFSPVIIAVTAVVGAVVAILVVLQKKFGIFDKLVEAVSLAFVKTKNMLGSVIVGIAEKLDFLPGMGKLKEFGEGLQTVIDQTNEVAGTGTIANRQEAMDFQREKISKNDIGIMKLTDEIKKGKARGEDVRLLERQLVFFKEANEKRRARLAELQKMTDQQFEEAERKKAQDKKQEEELKGINESTKDTAKQTKEINEKTVGEIKTQAQFLDETANMLGRSIEGILGIGQDDSMARLADGMETQNALTEKQTNELKGGGGAIHIES